MAGKDFEEEGSNQESSSESGDSEKIMDSGGTIPTSHKRPISEVAKEESPKRSKKLRNQLFKPPTAEEMNQLRETENLFHSNLFRLQIEEMLKEVTVKHKHKTSFETWFEELKSFLSNLSNGNELEMNDLSWLPVIKLPFGMKVEKFKGTFQFFKPTEVLLVGSYACECRLAPNIEVDIMIKMPQDCLLRSDYQNRRYLLKRALYTAHLARDLKDCDLVDDIRFSLQEGDPLKPIMKLVPAGKLGKHTTVSVLVVGPEDSFKLTKLCPDQANVKSKWLFGQDDIEGLNPPSPLYNRSIAVDLTMRRNEQFKRQTLEGQKALCEGIMLLKVWLRQRGLDVGYGCFSGFVMSMYVVYLVQTRHVNSVMSSYQVVRNTWNCLAQADWINNGISLSQDSNSSLLVKDFHLLYDVVFVDATGIVNLCGNMSKTTFLTVKRESEYALKCLDNPNINSFQCLFMISMPFCRQYDHIVRFHDTKALKKAETKLSKPAWQLDCVGPWKLHEEIVSILRKGLGDRVCHIAVLQTPTPSWSVDENPPNASLDSLTVGFTLNPDHAFGLIEKGPPANTPEATEFRQFWGDRSELRRFRDGSICEAVVWAVSGGVAERRLLCRNVVLHLALQHLHMRPLSLLYIADQVDSVLAASAGEDGALNVTKVCDSLGRQLMQLEDLPLTISAVQGSAPCLRYADPFPPKPIPGKNSKEPAIALCVKASEVKTFNFVAPIPVVLTLALSSKWPDDLQAVRRIKAAYYIKISEVLFDQCQLKSQPFPEYVDVLKEGYVFRLRVSHTREVSLLKETRNPQGQLSYKDTEASLNLEMKTVFLPKLTSTLHGLHMMHSALGPASCLAKRWVSSHMLLDDSLMPEICVELIMTSLFLTPQPYRAPVQPQIAFFRFLERLATNPWAVEPVILNFREEIPREDVLEIENRFNNERSTLPPLFVVTPECRSGTAWTQHSPSTQVLFRLSQLAKASLQTVDTQLLSNPNFDIKVLFRTPIEVFDIVIRLKTEFIRKEEVLDGCNPSKSTSNSTSTIDKIPIVNLDFVQCFLRDLRNAYGEYAIFFYDKHGGRQIGVLFKPHAFKPAEFKVSHIAAQMPKPPKKIIFNKEAFLDDIRLMGDGLLSSLVIKDTC